MSQTIFPLPADLAKDMPCKPVNVFRDGDYALRNTIGHMEDEEAAARILHFSHEHKDWTGVTLVQLCEMVKADFMDFDKHRAAVTARRNADEQWHKADFKHSWRCFFTFGIYALFVKRPVRTQEPVVPQYDPPLTCIFTEGPDALFRGVRTLLDRKLLQQEERTDLGTTILYPTPSLITLIRTSHPTT